MSIESGKIELSSFQKLQESHDGKIVLGAKVQELINSDGFQVLKAVFYNFERDVKDKKQPDWQTYLAKMEAIEIIKGLFAELDAMVSNAELAQIEIKKLIDSESSTPDFLSLDGEGMDDGQSSE